MKSRGVPRGGRVHSDEASYLLDMEMHGFSRISFCDRAKGRRENFSGRGETRKTSEVTLDRYIIIYI